MCFHTKTDFRAVVVGILKEPDRTVALPSDLYQRVNLIPDSDTPSPPEGAASTPKPRATTTATHMRLNVQSSLRDAPRETSAGSRRVAGADNGLRPGVRAL